MQSTRVWVSKFSLRSHVRKRKEEMTTRCNNLKVRFFKAGLKYQVEKSRRAYLNKQSMVHPL
ncbi:hypothetical protein M514_08286 [Trichuris suis]|uniref:Uncharacterized protein n=1 Tax=Trichuris suis TaxID=68888 RepID=A0A085M0V2_9BILA|nr:hypothetical protein M513_08286 [Trichuris suis]KFD68927.1 hypothetical protein M514_08286 [Trichuris suis]